MYKTIERIVMGIALFEIIYTIKEEYCFHSGHGQVIYYIRLVTVYRILYVLIAKRTNVIVVIIKHVVYLGK